MRVSSVLPRRRLAAAVVLVLWAAALPAKEGGEEETGPEEPHAATQTLPPPQAEPVNPTAEPVEPATLPAVDKGELLGHIKYLSSADLRGREAGTPDQRRAAEYISAEFARYGLQPLSDTAEDGARRMFLQKFELPVVKEFGRETALAFTIGKETVALERGKDYAPLAAALKATKADAGVVFAGYGIAEPKHNYDDFAKVDLAGKWALLLRYEPQEQDPNSVFDGKKTTPHSFFGTKINNCVIRKAAGVLIVTGPASRPEQPDQAKGIGHELIGDFGVPVFEITREAAAKLLKPSGFALADLQAGIDKDLSCHSMALKDASAAGTSEVVVDPQPTYNVVARLEGRDEKLKEEVVVLGAHCDHVGLGNFGSLLGAKGKGRIHPGADDNASGTAGLLEAAQYFAALKPEERPRRSIVFIAFSGEEKGLLGSEHWVEHPAVPLKDVVAMVNMDMIGRSAGGHVQISGVGTSPGFKALVELAAKDSALKIALGSSGVAPSDNTTFFNKNIPVLFFFTGTHPDYHQPGDTWDKINAPVAAEVARIACDILRDIADAEQRPEFLKAGKRGYLGISPDRAQLKTAKGFPVGTVSAGSPAAAAGIKPGDLVVGLNGSPVNSAQDLLMGLIGYSPGDEVTLLVERGGTRSAGEGEIDRLGESLTLKVQLGQGK
ncbi:MAG: M28 family peptidase [Planctomycetes bacterium]|nr:M28 family peptidase [Planctomycetota bacterium]